MQKTFLYGFVFIFVTYSLLHAGLFKDMCDSIPIKGNFKQNGHRVSRRSMKRFLSGYKGCEEYIEKYEKLRITGYSIGFLTAIPAVYTMFRNDKSIRLTLIAVGIYEIGAFSVFPCIGKSDYYLRKAIVTFNRSLLPDSVNTTVGFSKIIQRDNTYYQDDLLIPGLALSHVLFENPVSRHNVIRSKIYSILGTNSIAAGAIFLLTSGLLAIFQEGDTARPMLLGSLGLLSLGTGLVISVNVTMKKAIEKYNQSIKEGVQGTINIKKEF